MAPIYSIVIPAYNEAARIGATLEKIIAYVAQRRWNAEVIVVNDGSRDNTVEVVHRFCKQNSALRLLENPGNRGKGYSVRNGMLNARGEILLFSDADLSSPIEEVPKLLKAISSGADVALFGRVFNLLLRITLGLKYKDTQCGFKAFTRLAAEAIFPRQRIERWGFDPEILFLANRFGFKVAEIPVEWAHDEGTRISPLRDGTRMFEEMLRIRWNALTGKYDAAPTRLAPTL